MVCIMLRKVIQNILGFYYHGTHLGGYWSPKRAERGKGRWVVGMVGQRKEGPFLETLGPVGGSMERVHNPKFERKLEMA
jgi:hypothetical protein